MRARRLTLLPCLVSFALLGAAGGCDPDDAVDIDGQPERGPLGKADGSGSCAPADCGQQSSSGNCWCDDLCSQYGDCCEDKVAVCDAPPPAASCAGFCGTGPVPQSSPTCWCDAACVSHGDCCSDYGSLCQGAEPPTPDAAWPFEPIVGVPNLDSDDGNGTDWQRAPCPLDDDFTVFTIPASITSALPAAHRLRLGLSGQVGEIRFWRNGVPVLGSTGGTPLTTHDVQPTAQGVEFLVEFGSINATGTLSIVQRNAQGGTVQSMSVPVRSSPMILNHHLQPTEHVWIVGVNAPGYSNAAFVQALKLLVRDVRLDHGHAAIAPLRMGDHVEHGGIVGAMAACLHQHRALDAEMPVERKQRLLGRVDRRVGPLRREGKHRGRPKHMAMGIAGTGRQGNVRLLGRRMKRQVLGSHQGVVLLVFSGVGCAEKGRNRVKARMAIPTARAASVTGSVAATSVGHRTSSDPAAIRSRSQARSGRTSQAAKATPPYFSAAPAMGTSGRGMSDLRTIGCTHAKRSRGRCLLTDAQGA